MINAWAVETQDETGHIGWIAVKKTKQEAEEMAAELSGWVAPIDDYDWDDAETPFS